MIFKSIRWTLQLWHALVLVGVLFGFGLVAFHLEKNQKLQAVDLELQKRLSSVMLSLRPRPVRGDPGFRNPNRPPPAENPPRRSEAMDRPLIVRGEFRLPPQHVSLFGETNPGNYYFVIFQRNGNKLAESENAPGIPMPVIGRTQASWSGFQTRGDSREAVQMANNGDRVVVGRSIEPELSDLRRRSWELLGVGSVILVFGVVGGWWMTGRTIRPVEEISRTARKISSGDLSQRILVTESANELGQLAAVLNTTFSRLESAFEQQARFTADAAHELRTPVTVLLTQVQTVLARTRTPEEYREALEACQRAAQRMRRLIESLLQLARLDAGQEQLRLERLSLSQVAQESVDWIRPLAEAKQIQLKVDAKDEAPVLGDAAQLAHVFTNLLTNAFEYSDPGKPITVVVEKAGGSVLCHVVDHGSGIAAEHLPHIFERFYRADKSRASTGSHTGLGLAISQAIMKAHGGSIRVTSQPQMETRFTLVFPSPSTPSHD